ncbi:T9SS type A sorting domain-containing protein [Flavivirga rizhaonensis]|uniref:T9SS type A sorting domain-containing protein n=1 Tax=Flavivirga rizhaonensis TaxID=2559571 RepID=A0A4S1DWJ4_9FLAO|nr:hypothetical protein [Flavivirga rizhaonensis]TGV02419.1 hypothetical protein EM932_10730 [Flavivirga rizhaonensis]
MVRVPVISGLVTSNTYTFKLTVSDEILDSSDDIISNVFVSDKLNMFGFSSGMYFIRIPSDTKETVKKLIVK